MELKEMIRFAVAHNASDIHLSSNNVPAYRVNGVVNYFENMPVLDDDTVIDYIAQVLPPDGLPDFLATGDYDCSYALEGCSRFRVNAFRQRHGSSLVMRTIKEQPPEMTSLNLPESLGKILLLQEGLVLVTGPTGSGKSTTIASIINEINKIKNLHIITLEDPVEYMHTPNKCIINQREIGHDSETYSTALRAVLREDPDIILMGEIRDLESMEIALRAAETGHLVFSTLHTESAAKTIDRLIDMYPVERQKQALSQLSTTLKAVVSQRLLPRCDVKGRIGMFEIMFVNSAIANLIREGKIPQIEQTIELNQGAGMITRKMSIDNLLARGLISRETAYEYSFDAGRNEVFEDRSMAMGMAPQGMPPQGMPMQAPGRAPGPMGGTTAYLNNRR
ncbi:MAG: PilT/PilU family type 4a pilus ATPase [Acutalibacteraceae bacterium]|nr:PilT/PilU family type 4a pilus ATPase [Acutalibacteraceae bacterium]